MEHLASTPGTSLLILGSALDDGGVVAQGGPVNCPTLQVPGLQESRTPGESVSLGSKFLAVAAAAVNVVVWCIAGQHTVQRALAALAGEAALVVGLVLAEHLLCMEHLATTSRAARAPLRLDHGGVDESQGIGLIAGPISDISGEQGWTSLAEPVAFQTKPLAVARCTVNLLIRPIAGRPGIKRPVAGSALEALLVPHLILRQDLVRVVDEAAAPRAALTVRSLQAVAPRLWVTVRDKVRVAELLAVVHGETGGAPAESVALRTKFASVADFAEELALVLRGVGAVQELVAH